MGACQSIQDGNAGTVIIFDWDDTLLCTAAIGFEQACPAQLRELESLVDSVLQAAVCLGEVVIVTNGSESWVPHSAARHMPRLSVTLDEIEVVSARARYESRHPGDPMMWKRRAIRQILSRHSNRSIGVNLVVLGASQAEIEAARSTEQDLTCRPALLKTVQFKSQPSVPDLMGQLQSLQKELEHIVQKDRSTKRVMTLDSDSAEDQWQCRSQALSDYPVLRRNSTLKRPRSKEQQLEEPGLESIW